MESLSDLVKARDVASIKKYMADHDMVVRDGKIVPRDDVALKKLKSQVSFWNQRQQARKILLNSLYGALLNEALRFFDKRVGQSVTLTGRSIVRHMNAKVNQEITGKYDYTGDAIVYADTDSCYFSAHTIMKEQFPNERFTREQMIAIYDDVAENVNNSFPAFMQSRFNTSLERGAIIKAGRELVASAGLFIKKKKYGLLKYEEEGFRLDVGNSPGKLKAMGLDLKRADTPKFMQKFLEKALLDLLCGATKDEIFADVRIFREQFKERPSWEKGSPKKVNGLTQYSAKIAANGGSIFTPVASTKKAMVPGHVRASINWNTLADFNRDKYSQRITDGTRIVVCKLRSNPMRMDSVAFPIDEPHLPQWFKELPFDDLAMEDVIIDAKLDNLVGVLDWDLTNTKIRTDDDFFC